MRSNLGQIALHDNTTGETILATAALLDTVDWAALADDSLKRFDDYEPLPEYLTPPLSPPRRAGRLVGMPDYPLPPWVGVPDLMRNERPTEDGLSQLNAWLEFVVTLSPDALRRYEQDHPAPLGWECLYEFAAQFPDLNRACLAKIPAEFQCRALINKMWQSTTFK